MIPRLRALLALALAAGAGPLLASCFSERSTAPGSGAAGECRIPLNDDVLGATLVVIRDYAFAPAQLAVPRGARVTWVNCSGPDDPAHTTTADDGAWDSPTLPAGATFTRRFDQAGSFAYHCEPHPFMTASVTVQ